MKKVLVTGGAGFIGSHLCQRLVDKGEFVICLDNLYTGFEANVKHLMGRENFVFVNHDITEPYDEEVEQIYNLACPASPKHYRKNPIMTLKTSVLGVMNMLELAKRHNAVLLQTSTSEVYGNPLEHPQTEGYWGNVNPIGVRSCYDEGKRCAETLITDYRRTYGLDARIVRIFNTYGPNMDLADGRVVSNFITQALRGEALTVYGSGTQTRSFCYVSDIVEGLIRMMNNPQGFFGPLNLGNPVEQTVLELARLVIGMTDCQAEIALQDLPQDDPIRRKPDITLAKQQLDWTPVVGIEEGLGKTIEYFRRKLAGDA